ncbi:MAG: AEC family transporter [Lachnospiraceae bacterium]|nr:AEC family transporter [Lachnospiraceae bacterium]
MSTFVILQQMAVIAILVLVGVYLHRKDSIDENTAKKLSVIVMDIVNPALIMSCVLSGELEATHKDLLNAIAVAVVLYAFLCMLGFVIPRLLPIPKSEQKFYNMMTVYTNVGFIGIPVGKAVLSNSAMLYVIVCNVMYCLLFYTHGVTILGGKGERINLRKILSPGTIMALLTLLIFWFDVSLPTVLANSIIYLGNATVFLSMALLGGCIAKFSIREGLKDKSIWIYVAIRMLAVPVVLVCILKALHFQTEMVQAFCLMAAMPVANLPLIQAEKIGENTEILSRGIMVTTVLCFITITLLMSLQF